MMSTTKTTTSLTQIKTWVEARSGKPARVKGSVRKGGALLRISFLNYGSEEILEEIPWDVWYEIFRNSHLKFLYQDKTSDGKESNFFRLMDR